MSPELFAAPGVLLMGALTGLVFGFLLQKGGVTRYQVILGQFLLVDYTMLKVMLSAVLVGGAGIWGMRAMGVDVALHVKAAALLANAMGGAIFGIGMAVLGYCPGTGVAALGDGSRHAGVGVLGMIAGSAVYAEVYPWLRAHVLGVGDLGKATLPGETGLSPWWFLAGLLVLAVVGFGALERRARVRARASLAA